MPTHADSRLQDAYLLIAELLLPPSERNRTRIDATLAVVSQGLPALAEMLRSFIDQPAAWSEEEYTATLELAPPCPLYTGAYLFDEPSTCRGAGLSGRNGYMIELRRIYEHFGLLPASRELPDYLPLLVEFLALSLTRQPRQAQPLRRRLLERLVMPALPLMRKRLLEYQSVYAGLIDGFEAVLRVDLERLKDVPLLEPADKRPPAASASEFPDRTRRPLPVLEARRAVAVAHPQSHRGSGDSSR